MFRPWSSIVHATPPSQSDLGGLQEVHSTPYESILVNGKRHEANVSMAAVSRPSSADAGLVSPRQPAAKNHQLRSVQSGISLLFSASMFITNLQGIPVPTRRYRMQGQTVLATHRSAGRWRASVRHLCRLTVPHGRSHSLLSATFMHRILSLS